MGLVWRALDWLFCIFFLVHIPITLLIDLQIFTTDFHPKPLVDYAKSWALENGEPFLSPAVAPMWFRTVVAMELLFQVPFFIIAVPAFYSQSPRYNWMRIPCIIYATQAITAILPILAEMLLIDYSKEEIGPKTPAQVSGLLVAYLPFLIVPVLLLFRTLSCQQLWPKIFKAA
eukprot:scpid77509/ scgid33259/ Transmembrane protein 97